MSVSGFGARPRPKYRPRYETVVAPGYPQRIGLEHPKILDIRDQRWLGVRYASSDLLSNAVIPVEHFRSVIFSPAIPR